jgi:hypothetical protein
MPLSPQFDLWPGIARLYQNAMETSSRHLMLSSASIIQEHTMRAFMEASRSCTEALAKNAMTVQQQSFGRLLNANLKAGEMMGQAMGQAFTQAWMRGMQPARTA